MMETYIKLVDLETGLWEGIRIIDLYEDNAKEYLFDKWELMKETLEIRVDGKDLP